MKEPKFWRMSGLERGRGRMGVFLLLFRGAESRPPCGTLFTTMPGCPPAHLGLRPTEP